MTKLTTAAAKLEAIQRAELEAYWAIYDLNTALENSGVEGHADMISQAAATLRTLRDEAMHLIRTTEITPTLTPKRRPDGAVDWQPAFAPLPPTR